MTWLNLLAKEWLRRPLRTALTVLGVALATASLFSLLSFQRGYQDGVRRELDRLGAHILVVPKGCPYDAASIALHGASWPCYLKARYLDEVRASLGVATAAPVLMSAFYNESGMQTVYVGIDDSMLALKPGWRFEGSFPARPREVLVGHETARRRDWKIGQEITLPGLHSATGMVSGILAPTQGADDTFVFSRLVDAQAWLKRTGELTHILVRLKDPEDLDRVVTQLRGCDAGLSMNVVPLNHLFRTIQGMVNSTRLLLGCIALIAFLAAAAGVSNTLLMAVAERTQEIGVLRALGASRGQIFHWFWLITVQVCLAGAGLGILAAFSGSWIVESWLRSKLPFAPSEALIRWQGSTAAACLINALVIGSLAGLLPAWRAAALSPMEAIRHRGGHL